MKKAFVLAKGQQLPMQEVGVDVQEKKQRYSPAQLTQHRQLFTEPTVIAVDERVRNYFASLMEEEQKMQNFLHEATQKLTTSRKLSPVERSSQEKQCAFLANKIEELRAKIAEQVLYQERSFEILSQEISVQTKVTTVDLTSEDWQVSLDDEQENPKVRVMQSFFTFASQFVDVPELKSNDLISDCEVCGYELDERSLRGFGKKCPQCGADVASIEFTKGGSTLVVAGKKSGYQAQLTFRKITILFIGSDSEKVPFDLISTLNAYYVRRGYPDREVIRQTALNFTPETDESFVVTRGETSIALLIEGLKETGNSKWFKKINIVGAELWGWRLPQLTHSDIDGLMSFFNLIYNGLMEMSRSGEIQRKNSINHNWVLFVSLRMKHYKCPRSQFKLPDEDRIMMYQDILKRICSSSGTPYPNLS